MSSPSLTGGSLYGILEFLDKFNVGNSRIPSDFYLGILVFILRILDLC